MHHRPNHNEEGGGWSAFLAGGLIGAGVALLFAPQQGSELRGRLRDYATRTKDDLLDKAEETWDTAVERGQEYYDKGEEVVREAGRSAKEFAAQGVLQGEKMMKEAGRSAKDVAQHVQDGDR